MFMTQDFMSLDHNAEVFYVREYIDLTLYLK